MDDQFKKAALQADQIKYQSAQPSEGELRTELVKRAHAYGKAQASAMHESDAMAHGAEEGPNTRRIMKDAEAAQASLLETSKKMDTAVVTQVRRQLFSEVIDLAADGKRDEAEAVGYSVTKISEFIGRREAEDEARKLKAAAQVRQ